MEVGTQPFATPDASETRMGGYYFGLVIRVQIRSLFTAVVSQRME